MKILSLKRFLLMVFLICMTNIQVFSQTRTTKTEKPKPTAITLEGVLGKKADGYFLTMKDEGTASSSSDVSIKVPEEEISSLKGKMVVLKGMGYSYSTLVDKRRKIMITSIDSVKEVLPKSFEMVVVGTLSKKEEGYFVTMANKEEIPITNENKGGVSLERLDKIIGRKVEVKGMGFLKAGHVFTSIRSVAEPILILEGILSKKEDLYILTTFANVEVKLPIDEKSNLKAKYLESLLDKHVIVKGTGVIEIGKHVYTGLISITEPLPESVTIIVKGTLNKKGNEYFLTTEEKEVLKINLNDKSIVKWTKVEKLDGKSVEVRGKGYKKDGTHFTQIDSVKEVYIKE